MTCTCGRPQRGCAGVDCDALTVRRWLDGAERYNTMQRARLGYVVEGIVARPHGSLAAAARAWLDAKKST